MKILFSTFVVSLMLMADACYAGDMSIVEIEYDNNIKLRFEEAKFSEASDAITDCGDGYICLINNKPLWGADGKTPQTKLKSMSVVIAGKDVALDTSGMFDPLVLRENKSYYSVTHYFGDTWKVRGRFSDGAGTYYAEWLVVNGASVRVLLGDAELLYDAFENVFKGK